MPERYPEDLATTLAVADHELDAAARCGVKTNDRLDRIDDRRIGRILRLEAIWGRMKAEQWREYPAPRPRSCARKAIDAALVRATTALDRFDRKFNNATTVRQHGLWAAHIHLCGATVRRAEFSRSFFGDKALAMKLAPQAAAAWRTLTEGSVGLTVDISLDGKTVSLPRIDEPILDGAIWITGATTETLDRAEAAATGAC